MPVFAANMPIALDVSTLFVVAICVTALLGCLLLFVWMQDRVEALAWWGIAYLVGGFSVVIWSIESQITPPLPVGTANALLFLACGMIWNAARLFHGRPCCGARWRPARRCGSPPVCRPNSSSRRPHACC